MRTADSSTPRCSLNSGNRPPQQFATHQMSKFVTREFVIPPSPSPPSSPTLPGGVRRKLENAKADPPPALPDSLVEALAREPPSPSHGRNAHLRHTRTPSLDQFPSPPSPSSISFLLPSSPSTRAPHSSLLPDLPPLSPLGIPYPSLSRSPSINGSLRSSPSASPFLTKGQGRRSNFLGDRMNKATAFASSSDTSPLLSEGSGLGFYSAGEDPISLETDESPSRKSLWKAVAFGRQKARSPSSSTNSPSARPLPPLQPDHVVRSASANNIDTLQPSPIPLMVTTKRSDVTLRKEESTNVLGVAEEGARPAFQVELRRASGGAGRGIDQDLDNMDREERTRRSSKQLLGADESIAVPWRGGERYIHDLVAVEDGDDSDGEDATELAEPADDPVETLYTRRRQLGAEGLALLTISPTTLPLASPLVPPKSAPLLPHHTFTSPSNLPHLQAETMESRSWSDGRLDVTAAGNLPDDEQLAASLGLKSSVSGAVVIVRRFHWSAKQSNLPTCLGTSCRFSLLDVHVRLRRCCRRTEECREINCHSSWPEATDRETKDDLGGRERKSNNKSQFAIQHRWTVSLGGGSGNRYGAAQVRGSRRSLAFRTAKVRGCHAVVRASLLWVSERAADFLRFAATMQQIREH